MMRRDRRWNSEKSRWEYPAVHHRDGNPMNNDPANLELVWPSESMSNRRQGAISGHARRATTPKA